MGKKTCAVGGCSSRAWHGELCNYHVLEARRVKGAPHASPAQRLAEGRRLLRARAQELGIILDEPTPVLAMSGARRKVPSPMI